ncbi:MAG: LamG domain-containing protein, partial [Candidatus Paceibacter sp.]|nr:LamG domain-containing protein [Candidatus Paceibacter sp.]
MTGKNFFVETTNHRDGRVSKKIKYFLLTFAILPLVFLYVFKLPISAAALTDGIAANYTFNDGTAADSSGNGRSGSVNGATAVVGKIGGALSFNGSDSFVSIPAANSDNVSVSLWFNKNINDASGEDIIYGNYKYDADVQMREGIQFAFYKTNQSSISFTVTTKNQAGTKKTVTSSFLLSSPVSAWHHVVGTYDSSTGKQSLYVDGKKISSSDHQIGNVIVPMTSFSQSAIGGRAGGGGYFNGLIDEVRIYNRAISDAEAAELALYLPPAVAGSSSAVLNGTVDPGGQASSVWFEYGLAASADCSFSYGNSTPVQNVSGTAVQNVSASVSGLSPGVVYHYRAKASNGSGTACGSDMSFVTNQSGSDTVPPSGSVIINGGAPTVDSEFVLLSLSASDNVGVAGYYISENPSKPSFSDPGW